MRRLISYIIVAMFALLLISCAGVGQREPTPIKCPACGYTGLDYIYQP